MQGQLTTKSPRYENLEKFDNTKLKGVWLQDEGALFVVWDFHHKSVGLMSNVRMIPWAIICSFVWFKANEMWSYVTPWIQKKKIDQNQLGNVCGKDSTFKHVNAFYRSKRRKEWREIMV
jgi:hypothetical protein